MEFWTSILTEKSWEVLQKLSKEFKFVLIGGWAVYLWTKAIKSKDADIIIKDFELLDTLKTVYGAIKNDRFKKYEIKIDEIDVDIYLPYYSKLSIPVEEALKHTIAKEGFTTVKPEVLLILKQGAEIGRRGTIKGQKDRIDVLLLLLRSEINWKNYMAILKKYKQEKFVDELIYSIRDFDQKQLSYLGLNVRQFKVWKEKMTNQFRYLK